MVSGSAAPPCPYCMNSQSTTHIHLVGHLTYIPWRSQGNHHYIYSHLIPLILKLRSKSSARLFRNPHRCISNPHYPCHRVLPYHFPPTSKNFLALCASNYYDGCLFHRNIKGFMVQAGDPAGTGKGGQSIWGKPFADEIRSTLKVSLCVHSPLSPERRCNPSLWHHRRLCSSFFPTHSSTPVASSQWRIQDLTPTSPNSLSRMLNRHTLIPNTPSLAR